MDDNSEETYELLWIRHGKSQGNEDPFIYTEGDPNVELTEKGWRQAVLAGQFLKDYLADDGGAESANFLVGEFMRHRQTYRGLWHGLGMGGEPPKRFDSRLNEQSFGVLPYMIGKEGEFETLSKEYSKQVRDGNPFSASAMHGESARFTHALVKSLMDGTLQRDKEKGDNRIVLVTSGRVIQTAVMNWFHLPSQSIENGQLKNPNNCDIIRIKGNDENWAATRIYDGKNAQPRNDNIIEGIEPLSVPDVPDFILNDNDLGHNDL